MSSKKQINDLTVKEGIEDIIYHVDKLHYQVPPFCDSIINHIKELLLHTYKTIKQELEKRQIITNVQKHFTKKEIEIILMSLQLHVDGTFDDDPLLQIMLSAIKKLEELN